MKMQSFLISISKFFVSKFKYVFGSVFDSLHELLLPAGAKVTKNPTITRGPASTSFEQVQKLFPALQYATGISHAAGQKSPGKISIFVPRGKNASVP